MYFPRSSFSIAFLKKYIYAVGGFEENNSISNHCERFNLETLKWEIVNNLNYPSVSASLCPFSEQYLFKFGGL